MLSLSVCHASSRPIQQSIEKSTLYSPTSIPLLFASRKRLDISLHVPTYFHCLFAETSLLFMWWLISKLQLHQACFNLKWKFTNTNDLLMSGGTDVTAAPCWGKK